MIKKKLALLLTTVMTVSTLSIGFNKEIVAYAETISTTTEVKQTYTDRAYLSDLKYMKASAYGTVKNDTNSSGGKIKLKVNDSYITFDKGLFAHANSDVIYYVEDQISKGFDTFLTYMGVDASQGGKGSVKFIISVSEDNKTWTPIQTSDVVTSSSNSVKIQQKLPQGTKYLRLQADQNGHNGNDHAVYGDAVLVGDEYLNINMPEGMKSVNDLDKEILALDENETDIVASYGHKLYQREFINRIGYDILERIFRDEIQYSESIKYLFENEKALSYFIETGAPDNGDSYITVLKNFDSIYKKYKNEIKNDEEYLLKLAVTTSWAFANNVYFWAGSDAPQDVVERYEIYKSFTNDSDTLWNESEIEFFKKQSPAMLKYTLNTRQNNDEIKWFADYIKNVKNGSMNGYHYVEYKGVKSFNDPQYYGEENFAKWDEKYNLSKYNIDTSNPKKVRWFAVMEIDGVCGAIAKTYTALQETYGRPSGVLNQPGHAAALISNNNGEWSIVNDVSGWTASRDEMGQMPLGWGMKSWNSNRSASYIVLTQNVLDNYENYQIATKLNILADIYKNRQDKREFILSKAIEAQSNNLDAMYNLIEAYKADVTKTSKDYIEMARKVVENFKYYPLPMTDLLTLIQPKIGQAELPLFELMKTNALKDASIAKDTDVKQPGISQIMAKALLGTNSVELATFSFNGENANKIVINNKYSESGIRVSYSVDGGNEWIESTEHVIPVSTENVVKINATNDIKVKLVGSNEIYVIDIKDTAAPNANTLQANDFENEFIGNISNLEISLDNGVNWTPYTAKQKIDGNVVAQVRYAANGVNLASSVSKYTFTDNLKDEKYSYISIYDIVDVKYANEQNTGSSGKNMVDGMLNTQWHTKWNMITEDKSYTITLNEAKDISAVDYVPAGVNGRFAQYKVEVSMDNENWELAGTTGTLGKDTTVKTLKFDKSVKGKYIKITPLSTYGNTTGEVNRYASGYEFRLYEDLSAMANFVEPTIEYSTSTITNKDVTASVKVTEGTVVENGNSFVFSENGEHIFNYTRPDGTKGSITAKVSWIDKIAPTATVTYDVTSDNKFIVATATIDGEGAFVDDSNGKIILDGTGSKIFRFTDEAGNIGTAIADNQVYISNNTTRQVRFSNVATPSVRLYNPVDSYVVLSENEIVVNNNNSNKYTFTENGTFVYKIKNKETGEIRFVPVRVDWIYKNTDSTQLSPNTLIILE